MSSHLIVVADASRARFYASDAQFGRLDLIDAFDHPASRLRSSELVTDAGGRGHASTGKGSVALLGRHDPAQEEHAAFARVVAERIRGADRGKLVIVAPPRFLGLLRRALDPADRERVARELGHDYTRLDAAAVALRLRDASAG
jgi:protein required for attachment to host cells